MVWMGSGRVKNPLEIFLRKSRCELIPNMPYVEKSSFRPLGELGGVGEVREVEKLSRNIPGEMYYTFNTPHAICRKIDFSPFGGPWGVWVRSERVKNPLEMFLRRNTCELIPHMPYVEK